MCQADFTFSQLNIHYKRFKFDLILNKSVRLQFQEEVKNIILESLYLNVKLKILSNTNRKKVGKKLP